MQTRRKLRLPSSIPTRTKENLTNQWLKQPILCSEESIVQARRKLRLLGNFCLLVSVAPLNTMKYYSIPLYHQLLKNSAIIKSVKSLSYYKTVHGALIHRCSKMTLIYIAHPMLTKTEYYRRFLFAHLQPG